MQSCLAFYRTPGYFTSCLLILIILQPFSPGCTGKDRQMADDAKVTEIRTPVIEKAAFSEFTAENPVEIPEISIGIKPGEHPRLLCDWRIAKRFTQPRGAGPYEELIRRTREFWEA
jgi:hypothetical protein